MVVLFWYFLKFYANLRTVASSTVVVQKRTLDKSRFKRYQKHTVMYNWQPCKQKQKRETLFTYENSQTFSFNSAIFAFCRISL